MSTELRQREPRVEDKKHLAFIRSLPCVICFSPYPDPAHLRAGNLDIGKRHTGKAEKPSDCWVTPLCRYHHDEQHRGSELTFWEHYGIDPFILCTRLFGATGDHEKALAILSRPDPWPEGTRKLETRKDLPRRSVGER